MYKTPFIITITITSQYLNLSFSPNEKSQNDVNEQKITEKTGNLQKLVKI